MYKTTLAQARESDPTTDGAQEVHVDDIDLRREVAQPLQRGRDGDSGRRTSRGPDVAATPGTTGPRTARRGANEMTNDIDGDGDHSRGPGEPTLDPGKVHRELTPVEENPAPDPLPDGLQKRPAPKRIPQVTRPERTTERHKKRDAERDAKRERTPTVERDDMAKRKVVPEMPPPPPAPPPPAPDRDTGPSMGGP